MKMHRMAQVKLHESHVNPSPFPYKVHSPKVIGFCKYLRRLRQGSVYTCRWTVFQFQIISTTGPFHQSLNEPVHWKRVHITQANSEGSGNPVHPRIRQRLRYSQTQYMESEEASDIELEILPNCMAALARSKDH